MDVKTTKRRGNGRIAGKLTPKEKLFVSEYLVDLNATKAAIRAGYSEKTAGAIGCRMLKKVKIQNAIEKAFRERQQRTEINADRVLQELAIIGFADIKHYITNDPDSGAIRAKPFEDMPPGASRAIESITEDRTIHEDASGKGIILNDKRKFKLHGKIPALELLGQHLNIFKGMIPTNATAFFIVDGEKPKAKA